MRSRIARRTLLGILYDPPVAGHGGKINTLRLWGAVAADDLDFQEFSSGGSRRRAGRDSRGRSAYEGRSVPSTTPRPRERGCASCRSILVACSLGDLLRQFRRDNSDWNALPEKVAIQL